MSDLTLRFYGFSSRVSWRLVWVNLLLLLGLLLLAVWRLLSGDYPISAAQIPAILAGQADPVTEMILIDNRLLRILAAIGVGMAFGFAGELVQTLLRNPLASPDIIGFSAGAGAGALLTIILSGSSAFVFFGAAAGGVSIATLIIALSWDKGISIRQLVLMGIGISMTVSVLTDLLMTRFDISDAAQIAQWLVGSLTARSWDQMSVLWTGLAFLIPCALWLQFYLARLSLEEVTATVLGVRVAQIRLLGFTLALAFVTLAVGIAGPLPFVAFVAGPIAHGLTGLPRPSLISTALVGAWVVLLADTLAQSLPAGLTLPAGIFTALAGAPVLIWILMVQTRTAAQ